MEMPDIPLLRLQFEMLNVPLKSIAASAGINLSILTQLAKDEGWKMKWPDAPAISPESNAKLITISSEEPVQPTQLNPPDPSGYPSDDDFDDDPFITQSEEFVERAKKRLMAYLTAKDLLISQRYLEAEAAGIRKVAECFRYENLKPSEVKDLTAAYNALVKNTSLGKSVTLSFDEDGSIPTLVVRDLSNSKPRQPREE
jgi:phosphomannomutase